MNLSFLLHQPVRNIFIADCTKLIHSEINRKTGWGAVGIKGVFNLLHKANPAFIESATNRLLNDFIATLEPVYQEFLQNSESSFSNYLTPRSKSVAAALLTVTDKKLEPSQNTNMKKLYQKLRPSAIKHVEVAIPAIGQILDTYIDPNRAQSP